MMQDSGVKKIKTRPGHKTAYLCVILQAAMAVILALFMFVSFGFVAAYSVLLAGLVCVIANTYFALRLSRYRGASQAKRFIIAFYTGEIMKLALMALLMLLILATIHVNALAFLLSVALLQISGSFVPLLQLKVLRQA